MKKCFYILALLAVLPMQELLAWGQEGHRIVAQVAYDNLSCCARYKINKVLGVKGAVYWANWPDEIKSDTIYPTSSDWHFQDLDGGMSDSAVVATLTNYPQDGGNLWRALDSLENVLKHDKKNEHALRFLVHFMGDRFCPMHTGHKDDLGGNRVKLKWFSRNTNLHSVWDSAIIESRGYSYSEYAEYLENTFRSEKKSIRKMTDEEIVLHNYHLTDAIYEYQTTWDGNAYHYVYRWANDMEWQLYAAGIRLAKVLNEIY